jgi:hypothetical protein
MSERTGLGLLEVALLQGCFRSRAMNSRSVKADQVLAQVEDEDTIGRKYSWDLMRDLADPACAPVALLEVMGNLANDVDRAYLAEVALTSLGKWCVRSESGSLPPLPIRFILGTTYSGGLFPPLAPRQVIDLLLQICSGIHLPRADIALRLGLPVFPGGCDITGPLEDLWEGRPTKLRLTARVRTRLEGATTVLAVTNFPPGLRAEDVATTMRNHLPDPHGRRRLPSLFTRLPITAIIENPGQNTRGTSVGGELELELEPGADVHSLVAHLLGHESPETADPWPIQRLHADEVRKRVAAARPPGRGSGIVAGGILGPGPGFGVLSRIVQCHLGKPVEDLLEEWCRCHDSAGLVETLKGLRRLVSKPK